MKTLYKIVDDEGLTAEGYGKWVLPGTENEVTLMEMIPGDLVRYRKGYHLLTERAIPKYLNYSISCMSWHHPFHLYEVSYDPRNMLIDDVCVVRQAGLNRKIAIPISTALPYILKSWSVYPVEESIFETIGTLLQKLHNKNYPLSESKKIECIDTIEFLLDFAGISGRSIKRYIVRHNLLNTDTVELPISTVSSEVCLADKSVLVSELLKGK
jgi:hypothetical protein